jgi:hypothetical protein
VGAGEFYGFAGHRSAAFTRQNPVARAEELYGFVEGRDFGLSPPPLRFKRCIAF